MQYIGLFGSIRASFMVHLGSLCMCVFFFGVYIGLACIYICLYCIHTDLFCEYIGCFCNTRASVDLLVFHSPFSMNTGLVYKNISLFCLNVSVFCVNIGHFMNTRASVNLYRAHRASSKAARLDYFFRSHTSNINQWSSKVPFSLV